MKYVSFYKNIYIYIYICYSITLFGSTHFILSNWYFHGLFGGKLQCLRWRSNFFAQTSMQSALLKTSCCFRRTLFSIEYQPLKPEHIADHIFLFENSRKILSVVMYRVLGVYHCQTYNIC